jgi:hypothetical protein
MFHRFINPYLFFPSLSTGLNITAVTELFFKENEANLVTGANFEWVVLAKYKKSG